MSTNSGCRSIAQSAESIRFAYELTTNYILLATRYRFKTESRRSANVTVSNKLSVEFLFQLIEITHRFDASNYYWGRQTRISARGRMIHNSTNCRKNEPCLSEPISYKRDYLWSCGVFSGELIIN